MKTSNLFNNKRAYINKIDLIKEPCLSYEFACCIKDFFNNSFKSAVNVTLGHISTANVLVNPEKAALFLKKAVEFDKGRSLIEININEIIGFKMQIRVTFGKNSPLTSACIGELSNIAKEAGFDFYTIDNTLTLTQRMQIIESIRLNAPRNIGSSLSEALTRAFENYQK